MSDQDENALEAACEAYENDGREYTQWADYDATAKAECRADMRRAITAYLTAERRHWHCDSDPIECCVQALQGEFDERSRKVERYESALRVAVTWLDDLGALDQEHQDTVRRILNGPGPYEDDALDENPFIRGLKATGASEETMRIALDVVREQLLEAEVHCPCGARPESPDTHPHVIGCPIAKALRTADRALSTTTPEDAEDEKS